jgi:AcrR family transcriptional regulator
LRSFLLCLTVNDIASAATINRATFYAHYADKYALLEEITALAFEEMLPEAVKAARAFTEEVCRQLLEVTYDYVVAFYKTCRLDAKPFAVLIDENVKRILLGTVADILQKSGINDCSIKAAMISAAVYGAAHNLQSAGDANDTSKLYTVAVPFIMRGLA